MRLADVMHVRGLLVLLPDFCGGALRDRLTRLESKGDESLERLTWVEGFMNCGLAALFVWLLCGFGVRACVGSVSGTNGLSDGCLFENKRARVTLFCLIPFGSSRNYTQQYI